MLPEALLILNIILCEKYAKQYLSTEMTSVYRCDLTLSFFSRRSILIARMARNKKKMTEEEKKERRKEQKRRYIQKKKTENVGS